MFIHLQIQSDFQLPHLSPAFVSFTQKYNPSPISNSNFFPAISRLIQDRDQSIKTQCFAPYAPTKLIVGFSKIPHLHAPTEIVLHDVIKLAMVYPSTKLAMQKILVAISPGNALNIALVSLKLLFHLLQFLSFQVDLLLLGNIAPFVKILFAPDMLT